LVLRGETEGLLMLDLGDEQRRMSEEELRLLDQIALQIAVALDVARMFEITEARARREELIGNISIQMRESLEIEDVVKTAAREIRRALNLEEVTVQLDLGARNISSND
jgi:hypothetical protein